MVSWYKEWEDAGMLVGLEVANRPYKKTKAQHLPADDLVANAVFTAGIVLRGLGCEVGSGA